MDSRSPGLLDAEVSVRGLPMIASLSLILLCQLAGEVIVRGLSLPMPGPVVGLLSLLLRARGFAVGIAAHSIGTARAFQVDAVAGVFASVAMSLNALLTSFLVPLAATLLLR